MTISLEYRVKAHNTATESDNKIHDDAVARSYGFSGGLVPGVDVYAYLTHCPAEQWGLEWLRNGTMSARFAKPVYDGDDVVVRATGPDGGPLDVVLFDSHGDRCAVGVATLETEASEAGELPFAPVDGRPTASPESLSPGTVLGAVDAGFHADRAGEYLCDVREDLSLYADEGIAHPGWLLRFANTILGANVRLGPWIHVSSVIRFLDLVHDGDHVEARSRVLEEYERKGHRFVVLDVALTASGREVQRVTHTAIYQPRPTPANVVQDRG